MKAIADRIVTLGFGKYVRADKIVALVPIEEDRGSGRRTLVYVDGLPDPLVAGRTENTILRDMVGAESGARSSAVTQACGMSWTHACSSMARPNAGIVSNPTASGT